jgi:glycosyltransferase involved in cell wall biosynthesis
MPDYRIGVITMPILKAGVIPFNNLLTIMKSLSKNIFLITGDEGYEFFQKETSINTYAISYRTSTSFMKRIVNYLSFQLKMSVLIYKTKRQSEILIFFLGGETLLLPIVTAHLLRKKVILMFAGSNIKMLSSRKDPLVGILKIFQFISCTFADRILVYADRIIDEYSLERWTGKIVIAREHYIDFDRFKIEKEYLSRDCIVGYVGRFSEEKGIMQLVHAVSDIVIKKPSIKFLFIGDGSLQVTMQHYILENNLNDSIIHPGWVSHDLLADYLNNMKLLVIPSDTEGLPNVMLEAMACGTPVLATPVGGIPTIIKNGETGFILENNSPHCISSNVIRILADKKTVSVIENAHQLMQKEFQLKNRVENFKKIFDDVSSP